MVNLLGFFCASTELYLFIMALAFIIYGVFDKNSSAKKLKIPTIFVLICSLAFLFLTVPINSIEVFDGLFYTDQSIVFIKAIIVTISIFFVMMAVGVESKEVGGLNLFEFPVIIIFSLIGMLTLVSANDFISLYLSIELMSLAMYVLAAFCKESRFSGEAGLKYFILGALSSGMMLYGASLIYGFSGSLNFTSLSEVLSLSENISADHVLPGVKIGLVLVMVGFLFKLSAAPFHYWTPDVYEGASLPVTAFFAIMPKLAAFIAFYNLLSGPFLFLKNVWQPILFTAAVFSLLVGAVGGLLQKRLKRLMAYSAISNVGFVLLALATGADDVLATVVLYFIIYMVTLLGIFAFMFKMVSAGKITDDISSLAGVAKTDPWFALFFSILLFSLAGIPPMWGFYAKFYIIKLTLSANFVEMSVLALLSSVISAFYYIKIVKVMYFDNFSVKTISTFEVTTSGSLIGGISALLALLGFLLISAMSSYIIQYL